MAINTSIAQPSPSDPPLAEPFPLCPHRPDPPLVDGVCALCTDWERQDLADAIFRFCWEGER